MLSLTFEVLLLTPDEAHCQVRTWLYLPALLSLRLLSVRSVCLRERTEFG